jgi:hypothetical protein
VGIHRFNEIGEANYRKALALAEPRYAPARHIAAWASVKALGRRGVVYTLGWNDHAFGRTALLLNRVDEARHDATVDAAACMEPN